jgi:hypothetical protein
MDSLDVVHEAIPVDTRPKFGLCCPQKWPACSGSQNSVMGISEVISSRIPQIQRRPKECKLSTTIGGQKAENKG